MTLQTKYLKLFQDDRILLDIYTDHFEESTYGFILEFNDDFLLLEQYTDMGEPDGIGIFRKENITRIRWEGNDIENVYRFVLKEKRIENIDQIKIDSLPEILKSVQERFQCLTLHIQHIDTGMCIIGEMLEIDDEFILIHEFGTFKTNDRKKIIFSLDEITKIEAGGHYENNIKELFVKAD